MAYNKNLTDRVRKSLSVIPGVEEKVMFRGVTFMVNGKMCVSAGDDELLCRVDPDLHDTLVKKKGCRTMTMKGKEYRGYVYVKEEMISAKKDLDYWIGLSLAFNKKAKSSRKK